MLEVIIEWVLIVVFSMAMGVLASIMYESYVATIEICAAPELINGKHPSRTFLYAMQDNIRKHSFGLDFWFGIFVLLIPVWGAYMIHG